MNTNGFNLYVPATVAEVAATSELQIPSEEVTQDFDARYFVSKQTGSASTYAPNAYTNYTEDLFNIPWVDNTNVNHTRFNVAYPEKILQARYQAVSPNAANFEPTNRSIGWRVAGGNVGAMRNFTPSSQFQSASGLSADMKLKANQVTQGGNRAQDILFSGNTYTSGIGESAKAAKGSSSDSLMNIGIRAAQICIHKAWLATSRILPLAGAITNADPGLTAMQGDFLDNTWGAANAQLWGNESCTILNRAVYPFGLNYPSSPVLGQPAVLQGGTGRWAIVTGLSSLPSGSVNSVINLGASFHTSFVGKYGAVIALFLLALGPGPVAPFLIAGNLENNVVAALLSYLPAASRIYTRGSSEIVFLVPSDAQAQYPTNPQQAYVSAYYDYFSGPTNDGCIAPNTQINVSYATAQANGITWYSMAGMIRSWYSTINALEVSDVFETICSARGADYRAGVFYALANNCLYNTLSTVNAMGAPQVIGDYGPNIISDNPVNYDSTRPRDYVNNLNGAIYPTTEPTSSDDAIPGFDLTWLNSVLIGSIIPDKYDAVMDYPSLLTKPELLQATIYICRCIAAGHQMLYDRVDKPSSWWNQVVLTQPVGINYPAANQVGVYIAWRKQTMLRFVTPSPNGGLNIALAAKELVKLISGYTGLTIPRDSWGYTMFHYRQYPTYTVSVSNGAGGIEQAQPFTSGMSFNGQWVDNQSYKPGILLDFELYSVLTKQIKRYMQTPPPYTPLNFGLGGGRMLVVNTDKSLPVNMPELFTMVSDKDIFNNDTYYYNLRALFAAGINCFWLSNTQGILTHPRDDTTNLVGLLSGGQTRVRSVNNAWNGGWDFNIDTVYLRSNHFPSVDISGTRGYAWYTGNNAIDMSQWLSHKLPIYSNTMLFNKVTEVTVPIIGEGMAMSIELESVATTIDKTNAAAEKAEEKTSKHTAVATATAEVLVV